MSPELKVGRSLLPKQKIALNSCIRLVLFIENGHYPLMLRTLLNRNLLMVIALIWSMPIFAATLVYYSDAEGIYAKHLRFLEESSAFQRGEDGVWHLKDGYLFVYGGDVVDRGTGSYRVLTDLIRLKNESPERVQLLVGNRDLNKLAFAPLLASLAADGMSAPEQLEQLSQNFARINAPKVVPYLRSELAEIGGRGVEEIDDAQVLRTIRELYSDGSGLMYQYLRRAKLAVAYGNVLFTHAALNADNFGAVPDQHRLTAVRDWLPTLNQWLHLNLADLGQQRQTLLRYSRGTTAIRNHTLNPESVVYGRNHDEHGNPYQPTHEFSEQLKAQGLSLLVSGHAPTGGFPLVQRAENGVSLLHLDNSYARNESFPIWLALEFDADMKKALKTTIHYTRVSAEQGAVNRVVKLADNEYVGKRLTDGSYVVDVEDDGRLVSFKWEEGHVVNARVHDRCESIF